MATRFRFMICFPVVHFLRNLVCLRGEGGHFQRIFCMQYVVGLYYISILHYMGKCEAGQLAACLG